MLKQAQRVVAAMERAPLLATALLLILVKSIQFGVDSQVLFWYDSVAFIRTALGLNFVPERSYVYSGLIRAFAVPFHSLPVIVGMQVIMGGLTAWMLTFALIRFLRVRSWIAILAGMVFAFDPVQVLYERLVMTETAAMLAMAIFLLAALKYLGNPSLSWLVILAFLGVLLVSLRLVYVPVVMAVAVLLPLAAYFPLSAGRMRPLALALLVSCGSTALFHQGYRSFTGWFAAGEPAYHYKTGFFLLATVAPLVKSTDGEDARVAAAIEEQNRSAFPLSNPDIRTYHLWNKGGLVSKIRTIFVAKAAHAASRTPNAPPIGLFSEREADQAARRLARSTILRDPLGFVGLGLHSYLSFWRGIPDLWWELPSENGSFPPPTVNADNALLVLSAFGADVSNQQTLHTPSRQYHEFVRYWCVFLLASPVLAGFAWWLTPGNAKGLALLFVWNCLLLVATCIGSQELAYRYLHPFSFTGIATGAVLFEKLAGSALHYSSTRVKAVLAGGINLGRVLVGGLVAGVVIDLFEAILNGFLQQQRWAGVMTGLGRSISVKQTIAFNGWGLATGILLVWLYAALRPRFGAGPRTALLAGALLWCLVDAMGLARPLFLHMHQAGTTVAAVAFELAGMLLAALAGAYLYREDAATVREFAMQSDERTTGS